MAAVQPIQRGDATSVQFTLKKKDGTPLDVPNRLRWWMGKNTESVGAGVLIQKDSTIGSAITVTLVGGFYVATVILDPADTKTLALGPYYHELSILDAVSKPNTVFKGWLTLEPTMINSHI